MVTNFRLIELSENMPAVCCMTDGSCLTFIARSWFLTGIDTGFLVRTRHQAWTNVQVQQESLCINPSLRSSFFYGLDRDDCARAMKFMKGLSNFDMPPVFARGDNQPMVQVPSVLQKEHLELVPSEQVVGEFKGSGLKYKGLLGCEPPSCIMYPFTCGLPV